VRVTRKFTELGTRSSPRKRGPRFLPKTTWIPASAGMNGMQI
jgi:hypothetical protein